MERSDLKVLMTTFADNEAALAAVRILLTERLIACGTVIPGASSLYLWEGVIEESCEVVVLLKTDLEHVGNCTERLKALHSYEIPGIFVIDPERVSVPYASWAREALRNER